MRHALHAEWTKLRTAPGTALLLAASIVLTVGASALAAAIVKCPGSCTADTTKLSLTGVMLGQATVATLAVLVMSSEYSTGHDPGHAGGDAAPACPAGRQGGRGHRRGAGGGRDRGGRLAAGGPAARAGQRVHHRATASCRCRCPHGPTLRAAAGSVLYLALIALLSLGAATALRDSAVAITVVLGLLYIFPVLGDVILNPVWQHRIERWAPMNAGLAIQATRNLGALPIGPWPGLGVLAAWAAAALLAGGLLLRLRDA